MAISKQRLEELIEKGAMIWRSMCGDIHKIRLDKRYFFCDDNKLCWHTIAKLTPRLFVDFEHLFETKEDAEEYAEFGNITRTERLELPGWEEFNKVSSFTFKRKDGTDMEIAIWHNCPDDDCKTIKITRSYDWSACCFEKPLTRENYNEARRLCVKLFKGEKV